MNHVEEPLPSGTVRRILDRTSELPRKLEASLHERPLVTAAAVAGVAFVAGTIAGSRVARAVFVAAVPSLMRRLLDGPLGQDLDAYVRRILKNKAPSNAS